MALWRKCGRKTLCGLLMLLAICGNLLLASLLYMTYTKLHYARIFPLGYVTDVKSVAQKWPTGSVAIYGDSRAYLWRADKVAASRAVVNLGHGGVTTAQVLLQLQTTPSVHTSWSLLQVGINDIHPLGMLENEREVILDNLERNIDASVVQLLARSEHVVVMTIIPPGPVPAVRYGFWDRATLEYVARINTHIRTLPAVSVGRVHVLDASALLGGDANYLDAGYVSNDFFLHLNQHAYDMITASLLKLLAEFP